VGVGADEMMVQDFFGSRLVNPSADLDEETLKAIADKTGGAYFRARDAESLAKIYEELDKLEPVESDQESIRPVDELFYWPLSAGFLLVLTAVFFSMLPVMRTRAAVL
jgi:Ca-activated chloride channel family protein